ncbi:MAG: hypothetical protein IIW54_03160 [Lachnospiraceae bacterium]|nr:hypothetical protein [Lachnospiraceae bacterium]
MSELMEIRNRALVDFRKIVAESTDTIKEAYQWIIRLANKARNEGLLALEFEVGYMPKDMPLCNEVGWMVRLITNGTAPEFIVEWMTLKYMGEGYTGIQGLLFFLYARGILLIQAGEPPYRIEEVFNAVLPTDTMFFDKQYNIWVDEKIRRVEEIKKLLSEKEKDCLKNIANYMLGLSEEEWKMITEKREFYGFDKVIPYLDEQTQLLVKEHVNDSRYYTIMQFPEIIKEQELYQIEVEIKGVIIALRHRIEPTGLLADILHRNDEEMQDLIRELDNSTIVLALKGECKEVKDKFFENISLRLKYQIEDDMEYFFPVRRCDVEDAQRSIRHIAEEKLGWNWREE